MIANLTPALKGTFLAAGLSSSLLILISKNVWLSNPDFSFLSQNQRFLISQRGLVENLLIPLIIALLTATMAFLFSRLQRRLSDSTLARRMAEFFLVGGYLGVTTLTILAASILAY